MPDHQSTRQRFANRLRTLRNEKGMTQEQLAELIGKTVEHISFLERAERSPSFELLFDLAEVLEMPVSMLLADADKDITETIGITPIAETAPLPAPAAETRPAIRQQKSDLERLNEAFEGIRKMQELANEYGINDILQDNGGKVLQVLILLGLRISPGREGNDAVDAEGNEYELKTINRLLNKNAGITTHHHLNVDILNKYRAVKAWYIAIYEGVELREIYRLEPEELEVKFAEWEGRLLKGEGPINNPKIPMWLVRRGELVYPTQEAGVQQAGMDLDS